MKPTFIMQWRDLSYTMLSSDPRKWPEKPDLYEFKKLVCVFHVRYKPLCDQKQSSSTRKGMFRQTCKVVINKFFK
jgi:hypothetical protein